jgi:hypothetical protein
MYKSLKGVLLFAAMIALPIVLDNFVSRRPGVPINAPAAAWIFAVLLLFAAILTAVLAIRIYAVSDEVEKITGWLKLAEREFNNIINSGYNQAGRLGRVTERTEWNRMAPEPAIQIFNAGYRTVAHEAFDANQADLKSRGRTMGRAGLTAFLLREIYEGRVDAAQAKVLSEAKNSEELPYIAPGIRELIGYGKFTKETGFEKDAGVNGNYLMAAVDIGGFPNDIAIVRGDKTVARNWEAIRELTQQSRPGDPSLSSPRPSKSRFWRIAKAVVDEAFDR